MLLFDENLSRHLVRLLADLYPGSEQVVELGMEKSGDTLIWNYAKLHSLAIVSKDADFADRAKQRGAPPKFIWLRMANCTTREAEATLRARYNEVHAFLQSTEAILALYR